MLRNWITVAVRSLVRHPGFSLINLVGLAVGLASCLLILLHVQDELSYDAWMPEGERVYRVHSSYVMPGRDPFRSVRSAGRMKDAYVEAYPAQVETATRVVPFDATLLRQGEAMEQEITLVDPSFFDVFDLPLVAGDKATALADPSNLLLTESAARKHFGDADPIGQTVTFCCLNQQRLEYRVVGVLRDLPEATHLAVEMVAPLDPVRLASIPSVLETWTSLNVYTYLKLKPGIDVAELRADSAAFIDRVVPRGRNADSGDKVSDTYRHSLVNLRDIRLHTKEQAGDMGDMKPSGDIDLVRGLALMAALILALGCMNFTNMAVARSTLRAREVAVRKVLGAGRRAVVAQFLGEAALLAVASILAALVLAELALPAFNALTGKSLDLPLGDPAFHLQLLALVAAVALVGGAYPAFYLSRFRPARILKGEMEGEAGTARTLRTSLVVVQFAIAIALTTVTVVVYNQTLFVSRAELGFERQGVVVLRNLGAQVPGPQRAALVEEIRRLPGVQAAALGSDVPTDNDENGIGLVRADRPGERHSLNVLHLDEGYLELYGVRPVAGRTFQEAYGTDPVRVPEGEGRGSGAAVVNESAARLLGYRTPQEALGQRLDTSLWDKAFFDITIVGVIPDIRFRSLKFEVQPTIMLNDERRFDVLSVRVATGDPSALMGRLQQVWRAHIQDQPFDAHWLEDMITGQYRDQQVQATLFATFAGLAILVACLGLYGLSGFAAQRRTKEIGLRKVFGATVAHIVRLMVWQFSKPVLLANLVAWPVAWLVLAEWLEGFDRRIALNPAYFVAAGLLALLIAWATVASHAARVASASPIRALRYE